MARWKAIDPVLTGAVIALTTLRPSARARAKNSSYSRRASPRPRAAGATPTKWM